MTDSDVWARIEALETHVQELKSVQDLLMRLLATTRPLASMLEFYGGTEATERALYGLLDELAANARGPKSRQPTFSYFQMRLAEILPSPARRQGVHPDADRHAEIDDLGMRKLPHTAAEDLLEVMRRYERASTLLTSNRPVDDWGKLLGDTAAVTALLDRLLHHAHVLKCGPRSWRTKVDTDLRTEAVTQ